VTTRVIQWATGPVGSVQLAEVIDNPEFDLVGLFVYSPDKVGVDAGALVGRPDTGIVATNDTAAILALDAEVVLHSASKAYGFDANTDDIVALLETGKSVITVTSYAHLPTLGSDVNERIRTACDVGIYRDDIGRTVAERLARRAKILPTRPVLGSFVVIARSSGCTTPDLDVE
jgi:2,4-diaminopentanoate dehydrogenase